MDIDRVCLSCGTGFTIPQSANWPGKYCSRACRDSAARTVPESNCVTCGKVVRKKKFCTRQCYYDSLKGRVPENKRRPNCIVCDKECKKGARRYCSRECYLSVHTANNITPDLDLLRSSAAYKDWRSAVFQRDDFTCQGCGKRGGFLHADHIKNFAHHPELRLELSNGRTLCVPCHKDTPNYGFRAWRVCVAADATGY